MAKAPAERIVFLGVDQMILPLTEHLARKGIVSNIKRLMDRGSANESISSYPAWTPTNWATIATGADTGTHGVTSWFADLPTGEIVSAFHSYAVKAETIWEAAERQGLKSAVVHYPASMPSRLKGGYVVDGDASTGYGESRYEITPAITYTTIPNIPYSHQLSLKAATGWKNSLSSASQPLAAPIRIIPKFRGEDKELHLLVCDSSGRGYDTVMVCREEDGDTCIAKVSLGKWSPWVLQDFRTEGQLRKGTMRFKLVELSPEGHRIRLYRSQIMPVEGFTEPTDLGLELVNKIGPYQEHASEIFHLAGATDFLTCLEEARYQLHWFVSAAKYFLNEKNCHVFFCHWHFLDDINHHHLAHIDPKWPYYNPEEAGEHLKVIEETYHVLDDAVGELLSLPENGIYVVVASDHGNLPITRRVHIERFLKNQGFLVVKDESRPLITYDEMWFQNIDWERTKVYLRRGPYIDFSIYVNPKFKGDVYETIQDEVVKALRTWVDPEIGRTPVAIALRKQEAALLGLWGPDIGDIIFVLEREYSIRLGLVAGIKDTGLEVESLKGIISAGHGWQLPTAKTGLSSHLGAFIIAGPRIKEGYRRRVEELGYMRTKDITPTLCFLLGIVPPAQSQGSVAYDLLKGHEAARSRPSVKVQDREIDPRILPQRGMYDLASVEEKEGWKEKVNYMERLMKMKNLKRAARELHAQKASDEG